ncbi:MAG: S-layer homology domain-containing protein [Clostridiales bacterium]|nr:S-layer homology domain-containing protein [Clostridiales bacterium]
MKKLITAAVVSGLLLAGTTAMAYTFPNSYWPASRGYGAALESGDDQGIITYGKQIIDIMANQPECSEVTDNRAAKSYEIAKAYERMGDYASAAYWFEWCIPYNRAMGWDDAVTAAEVKVNQFTPRFDLYTLSDTPQASYGAKNEPANGILYGEVAEVSTDAESMDLLYIAYGNNESFNDWNRSVLNKDREKGRAVEIALNFEGMSSQLQQVIDDTDYINRLVSFLQSYSDMPIFLRIGAEMNVWEPLPDAELYKQAFIKVSNAVRGLNNVAVVWSVSHTSSWGRDFDEYYPGDEYVDWVGASLYCNKYFNGQTWSGNSLINEFYFKTGYSADPVLLLEELAQKHGATKPIMLAECGSAYTTMGSVNDTDEEWARNRLKGIYNSIPMVYPQVKLIAYFNKRVPNEKQYYDLTGSAVLQSEYNEVTKSPWFIQGKASNTAQSFKKAENTVPVKGSSLEVYAYAHTYGNNEPVVDYYIDGQIVASSDKIPYKCNIDISGYSGTHTLSAAVNNNGNYIISKEYTFTAPDTENLSEVQKAALEYNLNAKIMNGYDDGTIRPYGKITRAEFAAMVCRAMGYENSEKCTFADAAEHWASEYIRACVDAGAIDGVGGNNFAPNENVTLAQAVKIISVVKGITTSEQAKKDGGYPEGYLKAAREKSLLENLTQSDINGQLSRIDTAMLFYNTK